MPRKRTIHAINDAIVEEMERDEHVILFGEDVSMSIFGDTRGLKKRFGDRVRDTPISEAALAGMAVGAAACGYRVICHMMYANFLYTGFDAIANQAAKLGFMTGGRMKLPIVYIGFAGGGHSSAAQHSDNPHPALMNLGGLYVVAPSSPSSAKGLLKSAIRSDHPVAFLQPASRAGEQEDVVEGELLTPLGVARTLREGSDVTLVAIGAMVRPALKAADALQAEGIGVEVIDPQTLFPLDKRTILASLARTGRIAIADEARDTCSAASQIAAICADEGFASLRAPVRRVTVPDMPIAYSPPLEKAQIPDAARIADTVRALAVQGARN
jgi:acetoin:2,6-dichlorophenolindophenol oxidoreductase subunit beta